MTAVFKCTFFAGWGDMDFNAHMRNTAYLDRSADTRMLFFAANGFPATEFSRRRIGPVVVQDQIEYFKEIHLLAKFEVRMLLAGLSDDGSRFAWCNEIYRDDDILAARVTSTGGWLDLNARKLVMPPDEILQALQNVTRTDTFTRLPSSVRK